MTYERLKELQALLKKHNPNRQPLRCTWSSKEADYLELMEAAFNSLPELLEIAQTAFDNDYPRED